MYLRVWLKTTPYINPFIGMHSVIHSKNLPHKSYARKPWGQKGVIFLRPSSSIRNSINKRGSHNVIIKFTNAIINNNIIMAILIVTHFYKVQIMHIKFFFPKVFQRYKNVTKLASFLLNSLLHTYQRDPIHLVGHSASVTHAIYAK